jgi:hypothetical protein
MRHVYRVLHFVNRAPVAALITRDEAGGGNLSRWQFVEVILPFTWCLETALDTRMVVEIGLMWFYIHGNIVLRSIVLMQGEIYTQYLQRKEDQNDLDRFQ